MKTHDSLGRRVRHADPPDDPPQGIKIGTFDVRLLAFLHRHGGRLPTSYIVKFFSDYNEQYIKVRLKLLWWHKYIVRPFQQWDTHKPEYNDTIHEVGRRGIGLLKEQGLYSPYASTMHGSFKHQVFLSCVSASIELEAREHDYDYTPQHAVLDALLHDHRINLPSGILAPDQVFMLTIDGKRILLFLEIDRATEGVDSEDPHRKSWKRNANQYAELIGGKRYRERFNHDGGALLLVVTVSKENQDNMLALTERELKGKCSYMLFTYMPEFGRVFHPPAVLTPLTTTWVRAGHNPFRFAVPKDQVQQAG